MVVNTTNHNGTVALPEACFPVNVRASSRRSIAISRQNTTPAGLDTLRQPMLLHWTATIAGWLFVPPKVDCYVTPKIDCCCLHYFSFCFRDDPLRVRYLIVIVLPPRSRWVIESSELPKLVSFGFVSSSRFQLNNFNNVDQETITHHKDSISTTRAQGD